MQALEHERRLVARERETLERDATAKLHAREQDLKNREETFRRRLDERIEERLRDARREIDAVVERAEGADRDAWPRRRSAPRGAAHAHRARPARRGPTRARPSTPSAERLRRSVETQSATGRRRHRLTQPSRAAGRRRPRARRRPRPRGHRPGAARSRCRNRRPRQAAARPDRRPARARAAAGAAPQPPQVRVNVDLQPRDRLADGAERDRLQRRRGARPAPRSSWTMRSSREQQSRAR